MLQDLSKYVPVCVDMLFS